MSELFWLPEAADWNASYQLAAGNEASSWADLVALSNTRLDFLKTGKLHKLLDRKFKDAAPVGLTTRPVRLAVLGSSTTDHLAPGLRVGALRHNIWMQTYIPDYGQYLAELMNPDSDLNAFKPDAVLCSFDAHHFLFGASPELGKEAADAIVDHAIERLREVWRLCRKQFGASVIQQAFLPVFSPLIGNNEHRLPGSPHRLVGSLNIRLREAADEEGVDILGIDEQAALDGLSGWYDPQLWNWAKQGISVGAMPHYGELVARLLAAKQGLSFKCLVLDLDNTLWGGVVGDDGVEGIVLGQGSPLGEAYVAFQQYVAGLARRGVILAVCSKNDEANALAPFETHPEMVLKRDDIACFVANWQDKATNLREIAKRLNIGIDTLAIADDNAFERNLIRRELPMVAVPELPDDPARYAGCIAGGGYFEAINVTPEDLQRAQFYQSNRAREAALSPTTDMASYLGSLNMELRWAPFDRVGLQRIVQLINKTNQFNLTTRRYTEDDVLSIMKRPKSLTLQLRLVDQFGDNGIIAIVMGLPDDGGEQIKLDTWLMSCRVLGRKVEEATLNVAASEASRLGAVRLVGEYLPTPKNGMVEDHYRKLGFQPREGDGPNQWELALSSFRPFDVPMKVVKQ